MSSSLDRRQVLARNAGTRQQSAVYVSIGTGETGDFDRPAGAVESQQKILGQAQLLDMSRMVFWPTAVEKLS